MWQLTLSVVISFIISGCVLLFLIKKAPSLSLIDRPDSRKKHQGEIPLVGGLSIFSGLSSGLVFFALVDVMKLS